MYKPTIGLEIHAELNTKSKMFCGCKNDPDEKQPNLNICPVCTAQPGVLPVVNEEAVKKIIKTGLALNCEIQESSKYDRKNYFYPDLPKGYQISQYDQPLCKKGYLEINGKKIGITRIHSEEDTGKLLHPEGADYDASGKITKEEKYSLVDFNRAGVPLMELVTEPEINSDKGARSFAEELQKIIRYLDVSSADMEKGQMRVEVNLSLSEKEGELGTKVEIKNLNSFKAVEQAVDYEIKRQQELLEKGKKIVQETRGWDATKEITFSQREKESAHDYRYFPEPDLPPLRFKKEYIDKIKAEIPELPSQKRERFVKEYKLDTGSVEVFIQNKDLAEYFEKAVKDVSPDLIKLAADFLINTDVAKYDIPHSFFSQLLVLVKDGKISKSAAKGILPEITKTPPSEVIQKMGLEQVSDESEIEKIIKEVIARNQKAVEDFKAGNANALQFLAGRVMAASKGKANPQLASDLLKKFLS